MGALCLPAPGVFKKTRTPGWVTEIITPHHLDSLAIQLSLLGPVNQPERWLFWITPPGELNKSALLAAGVDPGKVIALYPGKTQSAISLTANVLKTGTGHVVLSGQCPLTSTEMGKLQQCAEVGASRAIIFR